MRVAAATLLSFLFAIGVLFCIAMLGGCSNPLITQPTQQLNPQTVYMRDMVVRVNGETEEGVVVVPLQASNSIHVFARGDLDMFTMTTCHREWSKAKAGNVKQTVKTGLFGWGSKEITNPREVTFEYVPVQGIEDNGACPMLLAGYEQKGGRHSWAFIDFQTPKHTLNIHVGCNGTQRTYQGVAACQARAGLWQRISFDEPVEYSPDPGCDLGKPVGNGFQFQMPKGPDNGMCTYLFQTPDGRRSARLTLIGYESILIRSDDVSK